MYVCRVLTCVLSYLLVLLALNFFILLCCPHHSFLPAATEGGSEASATNMKDTSSSESVDTLKNRKLVSNIILLNIVDTCDSKLNRFLFVFLCYFSALSVLNSNVKAMCT